jgi:hypothetical protein
MAAAVGLAVSLGIELVQLALRLTLTSRRSVDVDDVILNVTGACLGYLAWRGVQARAPKGMKLTCTQAPLRGWTPAAERSAGSGAMSNPRLSWLLSFGPDTSG